MTRSLFAQWVDGLEFSEQGLVLVGVALALWILDLRARGNGASGSPKGRRVHLGDTGRGVSGAPRPTSEGEF